MKLTVTIATVATEFPVTAAAAGALRVELIAGTDATAPAVQISDAAPYVFAGVTAGEYLVRATRLDVNGVAMAEPVVQAVTVADAGPQTVLVDLPAGLTVAIEAD